MSHVKQFLDDQMALAVAVLLRVHRISVMSAIISAQQMLAVHQIIHGNGLAIYSGELRDEAKVSIQFEPHRAITAGSFHMDYKFNVDFLSEMLAMEG
jgi:peptide chain release factor subunit 1